MKCFVLLTVLALASKHENDDECVAPNSGEKIIKHKEDSIVVKIEEEEYAKNKNSEYIGVYYHERSKKWAAQRWSKPEKKTFNNGTYKDEETAAHASDTLARKLMGNGHESYKLNFPEDNFEMYAEKKRSKSKYFGVSYNENFNRWVARRWSTFEKALVNNGTAYKDEETAARASDSLARKLMVSGEQGHKLNFPDENTEVYAKAKTSKYKYFGVFHNEKLNRWTAQRWSKKQHKDVHNGANHKDEETAARASDTLARKLMANGEVHKLNFPDDDTEVHKKNKSSKYFGVYYNENHKRWVAQRWSKGEKKLFRNGHYRDEEIAAHASDTLVRKLMANGEQDHRLNFPDDHTEVYAKRNQHSKRKRSFDFEYSQHGKNFKQ